MDHDALRKLIEAVETGPVTAYLASRALPVGYAHAINASNGDLKAAKALHDALLPGAWATHDPPGDTGAWKIRVIGDGFDLIASGDNPARAWLLAILRAHLATMEPRDAE